MKNISSIVSDMKRGGMKTDLVTTAFVASYEQGNMNQCIFYSVVRGEADREDYIAHAATEMADMIMQTRVIAELLGLDWNTIIEMGEAKVYERLNEFAKGTLPRPVDEAQKSAANGLARPRSAYSYTHAGD